MVRRRSHRTSWLLTAALAALFWHSALVHGQSAESDRLTKIKAAYLLNFVKFTEWPTTRFENEQSTIVVTIVGSSSMSSVLESLVRDEDVRNRRIEVRRLDVPKPGPDGNAPAESAATFADQLKASHLVYVDSSQSAQVSDILNHVNGKDVLTVSDAPNFCTQGGMLGLAVRSNRVALDANPGEINKTGVKVSSKVLRLARVVETRN